MHQDYPACHPVTGTRQELLDRLEAAVESLMALGADGLSMELLLESVRSGPLGRGSLPRLPGAGRTSVNVGPRR